VKVSKTSLDADDLPSSSNSENAKLFRDLRSQGYLKTDAVEKVMKLVDRKLFVPDESKSDAYKV
jgi:protein-L-isoaspartate O-methyltransferase